MQAVTLEVILRAVFGVDEGDRLGRLRDQLRSTLNLLADPRRAIFMVLLGPERLRASRRFGARWSASTRLLFEEIRQRRRRRTSPSGTTSSRSSSRPRHEDGRPMSDQELRDELMTLLVAGHETTATGLSWAFERLARHPDELERLEADVEAGTAPTSTP